MYFTVGALLLASACQTFGQGGFISNVWLGTWNLDLAKSRFDKILFPGIPSGLTIAGQQLRIEKVDTRLKISGETQVLIDGHKLTSREDTSLDLNGEEAKVGPALFRLHPVDEYTFEIFSRVKQEDKEYQEISRFVFSREVNRLTETKTQTERSATGEVLKSSTFILIFSKEL